MGRDSKIRLTFRIERNVRLLLRCRVVLGTDPEVRHLCLRRAHADEAREGQQSCVVQRRKRVRIEGDDSVVL